MKSGRANLISFNVNARPESSLKERKKRNSQIKIKRRNNWSLSAMVGDHTISGDSALTQRSKNGLSCKMVLQAVGKVLR